jgi:hypothetical protein
MQDFNLFGIYIDILNKNNFKYLITGSVASIVYGEPRLTNDIDLVMHLDEIEIDKFIKAFPQGQFYCPSVEEIKTELNRTAYGHVNLIHQETGFKADIYFAGEEELQLWAFENKKSVEFSGSTIFVAPPEYVILKKLQFYKEGKSQKHISDIQGILSNSEELINFDYLKKKITELGLNDVWEIVGFSSLGGL